MDFIYALDPVVSRTESLEGRSFATTSVHNIIEMMYWRPLAGRPFPLETWSCISRNAWSRPVAYLNHIIERLMTNEVGRILARQV
jgi:hypothetical protein